MEVMIPPPSPDFDFASGRSTPYAPSTPKRFGEYYFSAPTSPSRMDDFYHDLDVELSSSTAGNHHGASMTKDAGEYDEEEEQEDFAFDFFKGSDSASLSAEELFDGGKIRSLKPPPFRPEVAGKSPVRSPRSPVRQGMRTVKADDGRKNRPEKERGRDQAPGSTGGPRAARSLSPYRVSSYPWEVEEKEKRRRQQQQLHQKPKSSHQQGGQLPPPPASSSSKGDSGSASKKWKLKDFFLFRSASEGRATDKDPFQKYAGVFKKQEETRNSSLKSGTSVADSPGAGSISRRRRRPGPVSAHELHYTVNKALSEDLKKRTFLPYKQGILGRLAFNPAVHALANGFGSLNR
ncbi:hypothetical protein SAY86_006792 [Trapa natans]|uniref:Uncharacterized protein n=1 Tax=Trapa natans TaxID=22666 RepID=A0AAN7L810_TRANT|nr:hypothetical protein SAY86_006792 [Trapa natans]